VILLESIERGIMGDHCKLLLPIVPDGEQLFDNLLEHEMPWVYKAMMSKVDSGGMANPAQMYADAIKRDRETTDG